LLRFVLLTSIYGQTAYISTVASSSASSLVPVTLFAVNAATAHSLAIMRSFSPNHQQNRYAHNIWDIKKHQNTFF